MSDRVRDVEVWLGGGFAQGKAEPSGVRRAEGRETEIPQGPG